MTQRLQEPCWIQRASHSSVASDALSSNTSVCSELMLCQGRAIFCNVKVSWFSDTFPRTIDYEKLGLETICGRRCVYLSVYSHIIQHKLFSN